MELPEFPTEVDDSDPVKAKSTFLGRARQFVAARRRPGLSGKSNGSGGTSDTKPTAMFLKSQLQAASKDKKLMAKVERMLKADQPANSAQSQQPAPQAGTLTLGQQPSQQTTQSPSTDPSQDQTLAFDDGKRFRAARDKSDNKGKGKYKGGDKGKKGAKGGSKGQQKGGDGDCPRCHGSHPECRECPNQAAATEKDFDVGKCAREKIPCWYQHPNAKRKCGGFGHLARHHAAVLTEKASKEVEDAKKQGKPGERRLDLSDSHESPQAEGRNRALRLIDALLVNQDTPQDDTKEAQRTKEDRLDFGRGPSGEHDLSWVQRSWMMLLFMMCCAAACVKRVTHFGGFVLLLVLIFIGLPRGAANPLSDPALQMGITKKLRRYNLFNDSHSYDLFLPVKLPGGYNCRGYIWAGQARVETIHDTGSTRNSIDRDFLHALLQNESTRDCVHDVFDTEPLVCTSMQRGHTFKITKMALVDVTFKESSGFAQETKRIGFVVVPDSSEDLLLGKPTLDDLGFVSDRARLSSDP